MKRTLTTVAIALALTSTNASALSFASEDFGAANWTTGGKGLSYAAMGADLAYLQMQSGWDESKSSIMYSSGSETNVLRVMHGKTEQGKPVNYGITQYGVLMQVAKKHPNALNNVAVIGRLATECTALFANTDTSFDSEDDVEKGAVVGVDKKGSGGSWVWDQIKDVHKGMGEATVQRGSPAGMLADMNDGTAGAPNFVLLTTNPERTNSVYEAVAGYKDIEPIDFDDWSLNNKNKWGFSMEFGTYKIAGEKVKMPCEPAVVIANTKLTTPEARSELERLLIENRSAIAKGKFSRF